MNLRSRSQHSTPTHSIDMSSYLSFRERKEQEVYLTLLKMVPGLEERLMSGDTEIVKSTAMLAS